MSDRGTRAVRIANCSGFFGDHLGAARELLDGPEPFDVLTGDYLAELTMLILWKLRRRDPDAGWVPTFERQMADVLGDCLDRGIRVVANAGGLNPHGLKARLEQLGAASGRAPSVAVVEGDDLTERLGELADRGVELRHLDTGQPLAGSLDRVATANAYLGGFGIAAALDAGADVVVTGRVTDASLVVGPAAWWHGWSPEDLDALAGAVVAGPRRRVRRPDDRRQLPLPRRARPRVPGLPDLRGRRGRLVRRHQAARHRRRGHRRDRHRPAALRARRAALRQPRRRGALRHDPARPGRARTASRSPGRGARPRPTR